MSKLRIINLGPAGGERELRSIDAPGVYLVRGENGSGKTALLRALIHLPEEKPKGVQITHGETEAVIEEEGVWRVTLRRKRGKTVVEHEGEIPSWIALPDPVADLISGGDLVGEDARLRRRFRGLLEISPIAGTEELVEALQLDPSEELLEDQVAFEAVMVKAREIVEAVKAEEQLLDAADRLVKQANAAALATEKEAREVEDGVNRLRGQRDAIEPDPTVRLTLQGKDAEKQLEVARAEHSRAYRSLDGLERDRVHAREVEGRLAQLRKLHGERPQTEAAAEKFQALDRDREECLRQIERLQEDLAIAQSDLHGLLKDAEVARRELKALEAAQGKWDAVDEELRKGPPMAPSDEALEAARQSFKDAEELVDRARAATQLQTVEADLSVEEQKLETMLLGAKSLRDWAKSVPSLLGRVVTEQLAIPWLRVVEGVRVEVNRELMLQHASGEIPAPDGEWLDLDLVSEIDSEGDTHFSTAELYEACLRIMLQRKAAQRRIVIPWQTLSALDGNKLLAIHEEAKRREVVIAAELRETDAELRVDYLGDPGVIDYLRGGKS